LREHPYCSGPEWWRGRTSMLLRQFGTPHQPRGRRTLAKEDHLAAQGEGPPRLATKASVCYPVPAMVELCRGCMTLKLVSLLFVTGVASTLFVSPAAASCGDRPGTPTNVTATPVFPGMIRVEWTNTASETVWWDYDVRHDGVLIPQRAGQPPRADGMLGWRIQNNFAPGQGVWACYRLRARTAPGTKGCVSQIFSNWACARAI